MASLNNSGDKGSFSLEVPDVTRQLLTPRKNPGAGDFYICEFPKSGITYLTVLLANALLIANGYRARATFSSVRNYIVDLCAAEHAESHPFADPPIRLYKTHSVFSPQFIHSLYLVRHPADVMASGYRYAQGRGWWDERPIEEFIEHPLLGLERWQKHINSWLVEHRYASDVAFVHLIRYEDLVRDPLRELKAINKNFGWGLSEEIFNQAIELSSKRSMLEQESTYRKNNPNHEFEFVSVRGRSTPDSLIATVEGRCASQLALLGY